MIRTDAGSLMDVIARAAADPDTDVDKLERLMGLYERVTDRTAKASYAAALAALQPKLPVITERGPSAIDGSISTLERDVPFSVAYRVGFDGSTVVLAPAVDPADSSG